MRGNEAPQVNSFSYLYWDDGIPRRHPPRPAPRMVDQALAGLDGAFAAIYAVTGRSACHHGEVKINLLVDLSGY